MTDSLDGLGDGLPIQDPSVREGHVDSESICNETGEDLRLHLTHQPHMDLPEPLVPEQVEFRLLLFQFEQLRIKRLWIDLLRQTEPLKQYRIDHRFLRM